MTSFEELFGSGDDRQDNFRARLFGIFSENVVRTWAGDPRAAYEDLHRPNLVAPGESRGATLDFTLKRRIDGACFVAELKAEVAFEGCRYLRLTTPRQVDHHRGGTAFDRLLRLAQTPPAYAVRVDGTPIEVAGAVLVWGAVEPAGRRAVMEEFGFADVLSLEDMLTDLRGWSSVPWRARIATYRRWADGLFDGLC